MNKIQEENKEEYMKEVIKKRQEKRKDNSPQRKRRPNRNDRRSLMSKSNSLSTLYKKIGRLKSEIKELESKIEVITMAPALALSTEQVIFLQDLVPKIPEDSVRCPHCRGIYKKKGLNTHLKSCKILKADLEKIEAKKNE